MRKWLGPICSGVVVAVLVTFSSPDWVVVLAVVLGYTIGYLDPRKESE